VRYGDIYWAKPDPSVGSEQAGRRPVLVVSSDDAIDAITSVVTTIPLTTRDRGWATHISISGPNTGLSEPSWALCEQVRTIATQRIAGRLGTVDTTTLTNVAQVLRYLLNL
jgi:mRNA interferase MazF